MKDTASVERLGKYAGEWQTEGTIPATDQSAEVKISGVDRYTWILDKSFLLHQADVLIGTEKSQTYELIGFDRTTDRYTMQYFNSKGEQGKMYAEVDGETWRYNGDNLRFTGGFSENDSIFSGIWEQLNEKKEWVVFMHIRLSRSK